MATAGRDATLAEKAAEKAVLYTVIFAASLAEFWVLMVAFFYAWFTIGAGGLTLVVMRGAFIELIPFLISIAVPACDLLNAFLIAFGIVEEGAIVVINVVIGLISIFDHRLHHIKPAKFHQISYHEYVRDLRIIGKECVPIDSTYAIAEQFVPSFLSDSLCPVYRAMWPLPYDIAQTLYQPMSAVVADPTPYPGNNCDRNETARHGLLCAGIGVGYPVVEVVLPTVIIGIFILSSGGPFFAMIVEIIVLVYRLVQEAGKLAAKAIEGAALIVGGLIASIVMLTHRKKSGLKFG